MNPRGLSVCGSAVGPWGSRVGVGVGVGVDVGVVCVVVGVVCVVVGVGVGVEVGKRSSVGEKGADKGRLSGARRAGMGGERVPFWEGKKGLEEDERLQLKHAVVVVHGIRPPLLS